MTRYEEFTLGDIEAVMRPLLAEEARLRDIAQVTNVGDEHVKLLRRIQTLQSLMSKVEARAKIERSLTREDVTYLRGLLEFSSLGCSDDAPKINDLADRIEALLSPNASHTKA